ncbi:response regulator transcription factor [Hydrogenophaga sp.]|uniref:response regulator transcription factor n=1 Tax=Hydrogenophaga sp. TaxID=1904254 RepID=UPI003F6CDBB7
MTPFALKILVVEDNDELREATLAWLQQQGHEVRGVFMAEDVLDTGPGFLPDVYVIDLNLPGEDGLSLTRRVRAMQPGAGIVITTARTQIGDKVVGYECGADLYLTKPVHPRELIAGIESLGKRLGQDKTTSRQLQLQVSRRLLTGLNGTVELTTGEAMVLIALARAPGLTLERWQLIELIGGGNTMSASPASLEMRVTRLRKKLVQAGAEQPCIQTLHKTGYTLAHPVLLRN